MIFTTPSIHPLLLDAELRKALGNQWFELDPLAIRMDIEEGFTRNISQVVWTKINALKLLHSNWMAWNQWEVFRPVVDAFADRLPDFFVLDPPTVDDMTFAVSVMKKLYPDGIFSAEVGKFIAASSHYWGQYLLPSDLAFAQPFAESWRYRCKTCGKEGSINLENPQTICPVCAGTYDGARPFSRKIERRPLEVIAREKGLGVLDLFPSYGVKEAKDILDAVMRGERIVLQDTNEYHIQAVRAMLAENKCKAKNAALS